MICTETSKCVVLSWWAIQLDLVTPSSKDLNLLILRDINDCQTCHWIVKRLLRNLWLVHLFCLINVLKLTRGKSLLFCLLSRIWSCSWLFLWRTHRFGLVGFAQSWLLTASAALGTILMRSYSCIYSLDFVSTLTCISSRIAWLCLFNSWLRSHSWRWLILLVVQLLGLLSSQHSVSLNEVGHWLRLRLVHYWLFSLGVWVCITEIGL